MTRFASLVLFLFVIMTTASGLAQRIDLHVDPAAVSGGCPAHVRVHGYFRTYEPMQVTYMWERSDGARGSERTVTLHRGTTHPVNDQWTLGGNYSGWMQLVILEPKRLQTRKVPFRVNCGR